jgi:transposase
MLTLPASIRVFVAVAPADFRKGFDGLAQLTREVIEHDPLSGHFFVFANRRRDRVKILYWDRDGLAIWMKRLEKGRFAWPSLGAKSVEWSGVELAAVLGGIDLNETKKRPRYQVCAS